MSFPLHYTCPAPMEQCTAKVGKLTRHLKARLEEYFCTNTVHCDPEQGMLQVTFEDFSLSQVHQKLEIAEIYCQLHPSCITFYLQDSHSFEDIDAVWGRCYPILVP